MLALLLSLAAFASELTVPVIQGDYQIQKTYEVLWHMRWEKVYAVNAAGKERLEELKAQGYTCVAAPQNFYNCSKHLSDLSPFEKLDQAVQNKWQQRTITFAEPLGEPELVNNTEFFKQFIVSQKVVMWDIPHEQEVAVWNPLSYNWTQGLWKVDLGSGYDDVYVPLVVKSDGSFVVSDLIDFEQGFIRDRYFVQIHTKKVQR